jgi:NADP-dependent 3-hydroxy acid dehydrogenase YdfG
MAAAQSTAIVTGASKGIGAGLVEAFLRRNYNVVANSRRIAEVKPFPESASLALVGGDIGDPNTAAKIVDTAVSRFGKIDVLVNNAGIYVSRKFTDYTVDDWRSLMSVNIEGFLFTTQRVIKQMLAQKTGGSVVNITTTLAGHPIAGVNCAFR